LYLLNLVISACNALRVRGRAASWQAALQAEVNGSSVSGAGSAQAKVALSIGPLWLVRIL
jgi:hypothetical protein